MIMQSKIASIVAALALTASALPQSSWTQSTSTNQWQTATGTVPVSAATGTGGPRNLADGPFGNHTRGGTVVYWGQSQQDEPLETLCTTDNGVNTVVLAFVDQYGGGQPFHLNMGPHCTSTGGAGSCQSIAAGIKTCQQNQRAVFVSIGGAKTEPKLSSEADAKKFADDLWAAFGPTDGAAVAGASVGRPYGDASVDGFDFDIEYEEDPGLAYYPAAIAQLRSHIEQANKPMEISAAPICGIDNPKNAMHTILQKATFDRIFAQFYNDETCAPFVRGQPNPLFNLDRIPGILATGPSKDALVYVGLPGSPMAATLTEVGAGYFLDGSALQTFLAKNKDNKNMAGIMLWDSGHAAEVPAGSQCSYIKLVHSLITTGKPC